MNKQLVKLTKEELQKQVGLPAVYKEAVECAICGTTSLDDADEALCSSYFRAEVIVFESGNELHNDDKLEEDEYWLEALWFQAGWQARQRMEAQNENIAKTISKAIRS